MLAMFRNTWEKECRLTTSANCSRFHSVSEAMCKHAGHSEPWRASCGAANGHARALQLELQSRTLSFVDLISIQPWWRYNWWVTYEQIEWRYLYNFCTLTFVDLFINYSGQCVALLQPVIVCTNEYKSPIPKLYYCWSRLNYFDFKWINFCEYRPKGSISKTDAESP